MPGCEPPSIHTTQFQAGERAGGTWEEEVTVHEGRQHAEGEAVVGAAAVGGVQRLDVLLRAVHGLEEERRREELVQVALDGVEAAVGGGRQRRGDEARPVGGRAGDGREACAHGGVHGSVDAPPALVFALGVVPSRRGGRGGGRGGRGGRYGTVGNRETCGPQVEGEDQYDGRVREAPQRGRGQAVVHGAEDDGRDELDAQVGADLVQRADGRRWLVGRIVTSCGR